jgi:hypothetical protein
MSIYTENGYKNRTEYLESLAEEYEVDLATVYALYNILGDTEAFDALVTSVADLAEGGFLK